MTQLYKILEQQISKYIDKTVSKMRYRKPLYKWTLSNRDIYRDYKKNKKYDFTASMNFTKTLILCPPCISKCDIGPSKLNLNMSYDECIIESNRIINSILNIDIIRNCRDLYIHRYKLYISSLLSHNRPTYKSKTITKIRYNIELDTVEIDFIGSNTTLTPIKLSRINKITTNFRWFTNNSYRTLFLKH